MHLFQKQKYIQYAYCYWKMESYLPCLKVTCGWELRLRMKNSVSWVDYYLHYFSKKSWLNKASFVDFLKILFRCPETSYKDHINKQKIIRICTKNIPLKMCDISRIFEKCHIGSKLWNILYFQKYFVFCKT